MASNATLAAVSYGIGVQNRYSAFLEDEDGFNTAAIAASLKNIQQTTQALAPKQQKSITPQAAKQANLPNGKPNGRGVVVQQQSNKQIDVQKRAQQQQSDYNKQRSQMRHGGNQGANNATVHAQLNKQQPMNGANRSNYQHQQGNNNQENIANNNSNRFMRNNQHQVSNNSNTNHQNNVSHNNQSRNNKEYDNNGNQANNQQHAKFVQRAGPNMGNNQRPMRRPYFNNNNSEAGVKSNPALQVQDDMASAANEEEKRRRQQKRALDMKHKDPEKRELRKQQQQSTPGGENEQTANITSVTQEGGFKNQRNRPRHGVEGDLNSNEAKLENGRPFRGTGAARGGRINRRSTEEQGFDGEQRREGQNQRGPRPTNGGPSDRPQRNRNGFGTGSRGSRSSRGDEGGRIRRDSERQKPIPNFSDKLDFPSLAS